METLECEADASEGEGGCKAMKPRSKNQQKLITWATNRAVIACAEMHDGAWKGRVDPDELACLIAVLCGRGTAEDRETLAEYGVNIP